jgi:MFS family permease
MATQSPRRGTNEQTPQVDPFEPGGGSRRLRDNLRWLLAAILLLGAVSNYVDRVNLSVAKSSIQQEFHLSPAMFGVLLSIFPWVYAFANLPAGWLIDRQGPRRMFTAASVAWSVVSMATGAVTGFVTFLVARTALGIGEAPFFAAGASAVRRWFPAGQRGRAISLFNAGPQIAAAIAPPLVTALMLLLGWRAMFVVLGAAGLIVTVLWLAFYRDPERHRWLSPHEKEVIKQAATDDATGDDGARIPWLQLLRHRSTRAMMLGNFGTTYVVWVYLTWLPGYLEDSRHLTVLKTGFVAAIPYLAGILAPPLGGWWSDRRLRAGRPPIAARRIPIITGSLLVAVVVVPAAYVASTTVSVALLSIGFFGASLGTGVIWTLSTDVAPKNNVASLGTIQNFGGYLGGAVAPLITGVLIEITGSYSSAFVVASALAIVSALSYGLWLREPIRTAQSP